MSKIILPDSDDELLAQCEIETFRASGSGGQHVNRTDSAVRLTYRGIVVTCQEERSQYRNKMRCLEKLREKVRRLNYRPPKRIPTKKPARAKRETLEKKTLHKMKKQMRGKIRGRSDEE